MNITEIFIRRPVLAVVISLLIFMFGLRSISELSILQYPRTQNAVITVTTSYYGASPSTIAGSVTTPLENAIGQAGGIDYMTSSSILGSSIITCNLLLNYDSGRALAEINTKINSVFSQLPSGVLQPAIDIKIGQTVDAMYLAFGSKVLSPSELTDYIVRIVQPKLQSLPGVQTAELIGGKTFAIRVWLDPEKLASFGLTASEVSTALKDNDYISGLGSSKGQMIQVNLSATTELKSLEEFRDLIVKRSGAANVKLRDIANVTLGSDDYESYASFNGKQGVYIGIKVAPSANLINVAESIHKVFPQIKSDLPPGIESDILFDSTEFVQDSIREVKYTLIEAILIVTIVVFAFLGSWRDAIIPMIAVPLSLIGTFTILLVLGFSINLLTLLALVLAIGLVVDDAIIIVENVNRHLAEGSTPIDAAIMSARELAGPIIAMTVVLISAYVPVGFQGGLTGALFIEFAFTLAGAVTISAIVALTLSPMCCAKILKPVKKGTNTFEDRAVQFVDRCADWLTTRYRAALADSLKYTPVTLVFGALILTSIYWLYSNSKSELAPIEDQNLVLVSAVSSADATLDQKLLYGGEIAKILNSMPQTRSLFQIYQSGQDITGVVFSSPGKRKESANELQAIITSKLSDISGQKLVAFQMPPLPGAQGLPIQFVVQTTENFNKLNLIAKDILSEAIKTGRFIYLDTDLKIDQPQTTFVLDREKSAQLGLTMKDIGGNLTSGLSGGYVNFFSLDGRSYKVIPQLAQSFRLNPDQLLDSYLRTEAGNLVPVSAVATIENTVVAQSLNHFQQLNSVTFQGVASPGVIDSEALDTLKTIAEKFLPSGYAIDYSGQSRQFIQETSGFIYTFGFAFIIVFLALAALFESFSDPLIVLVSVPMSIAGAMVFIMLGFGGVSNNIYTQVGLVTLMGLISKHGILIVEFANEERRKGASKLDAILDAASIRLRPILMTTAAMVLGVLPLLIAGGAGAVSRFNIGVVIVSGLSIGTLFTLFVLPAVYLHIAEDHKENSNGTAATAEI